MSDYGKKIAELRAANKMTQAQLGEQLNVTSQAVSKWENGLSEPDIESIKKMCEIFNITFNEFFGAEPQSTTNSEDEAETNTVEATPIEAPAVILAYCDMCDKPLHNPKEYQVSIEEGIQHTTCIDCIPKKEELKLQQQKEKAEKEQQQRKEQQDRERAYQRKENWRELRKGMIWGAVGAVGFVIIAIIAGVSTNEPLIYILGTILGAYGGFAMISQMIWDNSVMDVFGFFLRTLKLPGVIFTLDLDGILFLIFVKIAGAILSAIFSVLLFILGLIVTSIYSMILFPFALIKELREL